VFTVVAGLSVLLLVLGIGLGVVGEVAGGHVFGDRKGIPNWNGGARWQTVPWWGISGIGVCTMLIALALKRASRRENER
jgi:formate-dependent nitrite reductase membrane component NrfD